MRIQGLIEKFKKNECTASERAEVLAYFEENPGEWDSYLNEEEFIDFKPAEKLPPAVSGELFKTIRKGSIGKGNFSTTLRRFAVAASIMILVGAGWLLSTRKGQGNAAYKPGARTNALVATLERKINNTSKIMMVSLEDGSRIELSPNSTVDYYEPFLAKDRRIVYLTGKALFKVAKDQSRPFTVFSGELATTVLGTSFSVTAFPGSDNIGVALYEGKVVVRCVDSIHKRLPQGKYLVPGDEYIFNRTTLLARVVHSSGTREAQLVKAGTARKMGTSVKKPEWYIFSGSPLSGVLDQLSDYYQVDIYYYPQDLQNKYFTTKLEKTDSLYYILKDIALLNRLTLEYKNGAYYFRK